MLLRVTSIMLFLMLTAVLLKAQEKPTPPSKPRTESGVLGVTPPDSTRRPSSSESEAKNAQGLPKFDLPEYVITGVVTLDLPETEKQVGDEPPHSPELVNPAEAQRDRLTAESFPGEKGGLPMGERSHSNALVQAGSGTYFTSSVGIWFNQQDPTYFLHGDVRYGITRGWMPFTNRSNGRIDLAGGLPLHGPTEWSERGNLAGSIGYGSETYRFYGAANPLTRTISDFRLSAKLESPLELMYNYNVQAGFQSTSFDDSSSSVSETQFHLGGKSNLILGAFPIDGQVDFSLISYSGSGGGSFPYLDVSLTTHKLWYGDFFFEVSGHFYTAQGMLSQKLSRFYPHVDLGYRILENTVASASYLGGVKYSTLAALISTHPYLSATSTVRQTELPLDLVIALETDWSHTWRTRFSARFQSVNEYPLFTQGGTKGVWTTMYLGRTSVSTYQGEIFAKFDANSYFTLSLEINSSKNSVTQWEVPYLPDLRLSGGMSLEIARGLRILPSIAFVNRRVPDLYVRSKLDGYSKLSLRGEYTLLSSLSVFAECRNLTDTAYEEWAGYRAAPLILTAGLALRW